MTPLAADAAELSASLALIDGYNTAAQREQVDKFEQNLLPIKKIKNSDNPLRMQLTFQYDF